MGRKPVRLAAWTVVLAVVCGAWRAGAGPYSAAVLADTPIAYWRLDETTGPLAADQTGTYPGTYLGAPVLGQPGGLSGEAANRAMRVNPADGGDVMQATVTIGASFSVELWVRSAQTRWNDYGWFASERAANGIILHPDRNATFWSAWAYDSAAGIAVVGFHTPAAAITDWHQYAFTYDAATNRGVMYFDGAPVATNLALLSGARAPASFITLRFGQDDVGTTRYGDGWLDEISLYNHALPAGRVLAHYQASFLPEPGAAALLLAAGGLLLRRRRPG